MNYPVIAEHILTTVQGAWWSRRRQRDDVPPLPPGAVHVFRVGGNYRTFPEGMVFDPSHPDVLDASSVSLVDTRARLVEVERTLPSVSEADRFTVRASFTCQVTDPVVIARKGVIDVAVPLRAYLMGDADLPRVSAGHRVEEVNAVRTEVSHRITAYSAIVPPRVAGMNVEFVSAEVHASDDLRDWEQKLRDERRSWELQRGQRDFETQDALRIAELLAQGSDHVDAFGIARNEIDVTEAAARIHRNTAQDVARRDTIEASNRAHAQARETAEAQMRRDMLLTLLRQMGGSEYVDYHQVLEQVLRETGGPSASAAVTGAGTAHMVEPGPASRAAGPVRDGASDPHNGFVKDEDDLVD
ncbi:SPFH domain-containing protein [Streptomyces sp. SGAir0957]